MYDRMMLADADIPVEAVHKSLFDIATACGVETARLLVEHFGGDRVWVSRTWHAEHILNDIGETHARAIFAHLPFGGEIDIPLKLLSPDGYRQLIRKLSAQGLPHREIARRLRCSRRTVCDELWQRGSPRLRNRQQRYIDNRQIDIEEFLSGRKSE